MTKHIGRQAAFGIGKEAVRGTADAVDFWIPWSELEINTKVEHVNNEAALGRIEDTDDAAIVSRYGEIVMKAKLKDKSPGLILLSLFGTDTVTEPEAGVVYDHTFSVAQSVQHQSLTAVLKDVNRDIAFPNAIVDTFKLDCEMGEYVMYETTMMSREGEDDTNNVAIVQERDFVPQNVTFKKATTQAGLDAASAFKIRNFSIEIKANTMLENVLGNVTPDDILNQSFSVEGEITLAHTDETFIDIQNANTEQAIRLDIEHTDTIGAASKPRLRFDIYKCTLFDHNVERPLNEIVEETFSFKAHLSVADSNMIKVILRNTHAAY